MLYKCGLQLLLKYRAINLPRNYKILFSKGSKLLHRLILNFTNHILIFFSRLPGYLPQLLNIRSGLSLILRLEFCQWLLQFQFVKDILKIKVPLCPFHICLFNDYTVILYCYPHLRICLNLCFR